MRNILILYAVGAALAAASGLVLPTPAAAQAADEWQIGPIIRGRNYSVGMPLNPTQVERGWQFEFPHPTVDAGHVHYVTFACGPLAAKSKIVVRYRVEAASEVRFVPQEKPTDRATVSLFFQRSGDSWSGKRHPFHRWYAPTQHVQEISPGEYEMILSLSDPGWISVLGVRAETNPEAFTDALAETSRLGLVFGSSGARGHGVFATGPARFTLLSFELL